MLLRRLHIYPIVMLAGLSAAAVGAEQLPVSRSDVQSIAKLLLETEKAVLRLSTATPAPMPSEYVNAIDLLGQAVETSMSGPAAGNYETELTHLSARLHSLTRGAVRIMEQSCNEDESLLENLYRSNKWHEINYARAAVRYWQAWIELNIARRSASEDERLRKLLEAERGFQISAMRILYPGIVYGSWWGLANVSLARDEQQAAHRRLVRLKEALSNRHDNPLYDTVDQQIRVLEVRLGERTPPSGIEAVSDINAPVILEEAFVLLQQQRIEASGAIAAAKRISLLIRAGYLDDAMVLRLMGYRAEIVGHDIGVLGRLIEMEYANDYDQFETVVLKFEEFVSNGGLELPIDVRSFRYRYAAALQITGFSVKSIDQVNLLLDGEPSNENLHRAILRLHLTVANSLFSAEENEVTRDRLRRAASMLIDSRPSDEDLGLAWQAMALTELDGDVADNYFDRASEYLQSGSNVELQRFNTRLRRFLKLQAFSDPDQRTKLAQQALDAFELVSRQSKKEGLLQAYRIELEAAIADDPTDVLRDIGMVADAFPDDRTIAHVLFRSQVSVLSIPSRERDLIAFFRSLDEKNYFPQAQIEILNFLIRAEEAGRHSLTAELADVVYPHFAGQPKEQRQLLLMRVRNLDAAGAHAQAFDVAKAMVMTFPNSGDAWVAYAHSATRVGKTFEAERGWARLEDRLPEGSPNWLHAMLGRLDLQVKYDANPCPVYHRLRTYVHAFSQLQRDVWDDLQAKTNCVS